MSELLLEIYSEEIPSGLQAQARSQLQNSFEKLFQEHNLKFKSLNVYSTPTRLCLHANQLTTQVIIPSKEIRGPKVGVPENIVSSFLNSHQADSSDLTEKETDKGKFYFLKTKTSTIFTEEILTQNISKILSAINWKKSMKWSTFDLLWGRPLSSIFCVLNKKSININFHHIHSSDQIVFEDEKKSLAKKVTDFKGYLSFLKTLNIEIDQSKRKKIILDYFENYCKNHDYQLNINNKLVDEVVDLIDKPYVIINEFNKEFLELPSEIIISTLEYHQKFFPIFNHKNKLINKFFVVANKKDSKGFIKKGNRKVVDARLTDAKFFWDRDQSKNLIKQASNLKKIIFYEKLGTVFDKTVRMRKLSTIFSDKLNLNKDKVELACSISKSDLISELVGEYPELQGVMGQYFALAQGFDEDVALAIGEQYLPTGKSENVPKKPLSSTLAMIEKIDTLTGFFLINEKPTSSKDPFALRRAAIGILRILTENKINIKMQDVIELSLRSYFEQGLKESNDDIVNEILKFFNDRMKNILKEKKIRPDLIEASFSEFAGDDFYVLFQKSQLMNKYLNKDLGKNTIYSYKRAHNILEGENKKSSEKYLGTPNPVLFKFDEEKILFEKISEIKNNFFSSKEEINYENMLEKLSETRPFIDNFFDKVIVNDQNVDIKNNRLELLTLFCKTFNRLIDFSKIESA